MALDKEKAIFIALEKGFSLGTMYGQQPHQLMPMSDSKTLYEFAQAIYALGVKDERERLAKRFDESGWHPYAEVIRNSNNDRMVCDSNIGS